MARHYSDTRADTEWYSQLYTDGSSFAFTEGALYQLDANGTFNPPPPPAIDGWTFVGNNHTHGEHYSPVVFSNGVNTLTGSHFSDADKGTIHSYGVGYPGFTGYVGLTSEINGVPDTFQAYSWDSSNPLPPAHSDDTATIPVDLSNPKC